MVFGFFERCDTSAEQSAFGSHLTRTFGVCGGHVFGSSEEEEEESTRSMHRHVTTRCVVCCKRQSVGSHLCCLWSRNCFVLFCYWILLNLDTFLDLTVRTLDWKFSFCERARSDVTNYLTFVASHVMQSAHEKNIRRFTDEKSWAARWKTCGFLATSLVLDGSPNFLIVFGILLNSIFTFSFGLHSSGFPFSSENRFVCFLKVPTFPFDCVGRAVVFRCWPWSPLKFKYKLELCAKVVLRGTSARWVQVRCIWLEEHVDRLQLLFWMFW